MKDSLYLVLGVVFLLIAIPVSMAITWMEFNAEQVTTNRVVSSFPAFGFDNVIADLNWIRLIQERPPENVTEARELAEKKYHLLDRITSLNPHLNIAYTTKNLDLMFVKDIDVKKKALDLFNRGSIFNANKTWTNDYYAAFTCANIAVEVGDNEEEKQRYLNIGHHYLKEAQQLPNSPRFIDRMVAHFVKKMGNQQELVDMWIQLYNSAVNEYDKNTCYFNLKLVYHETLDILKDLKKSEKEEDKNLAIKLEKKVDRMKSVLFTDRGHCPNAECPFLLQKGEFYVGPEGQRFCPQCGSQLKYPPNKVVCIKCKAVLGKGTKFCPHCGAKVPVEDTKKPPQKK